MMIAIRKNGFSKAQRYKGALMIGGDYLRETKDIIICNKVKNVWVAYKVMGCRLKFSDYCGEELSKKLDAFVQERRKFEIENNIGD